MMGISFNASFRNLDKIKKQLEDYAKDLGRKCQIFAERLADEGIGVATGQAGNLGKYISFYKEVEPDVYGCKALMIATSDRLTVRWKSIVDGQIAIKESHDFSPILMAEFGSGQKAENPLGIDGVGQGTYPGQTHAFESDGWSFMDLNGEWHHSTGIAPTAPMYNASIEMRQNIITIAKEVFGE